MGTPDVGGSLIPLTATSGSAWLSSVGGTDKEMTVVASVGTFNVSTATCGTTCPTCLGITAYWIAPDPFDWSAQSSVQIFAHQQNTGGGVSAATDQSAWQSDNTSVATVSSPGLYYGVSIGSFNARAQAELLSSDHSDCVRGNPCPTETFQDMSAGLAFTQVQHNYPVTR